MSASVSGMPGGQPSMTQPIAGPWLSPQVVMRKRWPKLLKDMGSFRSVSDCRLAGGKNSGKVRNEALCHAREGGHPVAPDVGGWRRWLLGCPVQPGDDQQKRE